jgi:hypothetical protein
MDGELDDRMQSSLRKETAAAVYRIQQRHANAIAKSGSKFVDGVEGKLREAHKKLLAGRDTFGGTRLADGSDVTATNTRLQFRFANRQHPYPNGDELPHPVTNRNLYVKREVIINQHGIKDIFATDDGGIEVQFKPEMHQRVENAALRAGRPEIAIVLDGKIIGITRMTERLGQPMKFPANAVDETRRDELLKLMTEPVRTTDKKPKAPSAR